jgi:hypothetical protein
VYTMLPVSLDCFLFVFLRLVYTMLPVSLDCFLFVFLRLVYPMLPVSSSCVLYVASFSGLSIFDCPIGILQHLFKSH